MCATYRDKQKRSHFESFANKIYTGIREIKPEYAEKRAIWELFQNALDTLDKNGIIEIARTEKGLLFKHNGRPFKDDEFGGLIKQFSVGKTYGDNKEKLGQYGTGFISTHVYGKIISVHGSIQTDDGTYRTLKDFEIDRDAPSIENLTDKLLEQDNIIEQLCDNNQLSEHSPLPFTSFEYHANESSKVHIDEMLKYIESILPYIFCFNEKLAEVKLFNNNSTQIYTSSGQTNGVLTILKNGMTITIPFLHNSEKGVKVIMGAENRQLKDLPKQFLFYPLMETVEAGYNFIVHANDFKPNKERDFLHKDIGNDDLKSDVETNHKLLESSIDLVLKLLEEDETVSFIDVAKIEFTALDSDFEKKLKIKYIDKIKGLYKLEFANKKHSIAEIPYLDKSILLLSEEVKRSIYNLLKQFRSIPPFEIYFELSKYVNNWNDNIDKKLSTLELKDLGEIIAKESGGNYYYIADKVSFQNFISEISIDITLLNRLALVPNIHGDLKHFEKLVKWDSNEPALVNIVDGINSSISEKYIHEDFKFLENLNVYNREKFKDDFSNFCNDLVDNISKGKEISIGIIRKSMLIESLKNFVSLNKKTQLNIDLTAFYEREFQFTAYPMELSNALDSINYQPAIKLLAHLYIKNISADDISKHVSNIKEVVSIMFKNSNLKEELLHKFACIPNQNYNLKSQSELKRDEVKDNVFKDAYDKNTGKVIRDELAYEGFETFLQHPGSVNGTFLGEAIESSLSKDKRFIPVDTKILPELIYLIEKISELPNTWGLWLQNINREKEEILMHKFKDAKTRSSLFSILSKNEKTIELLGDLAKIEDLEDLIEKGKESQREENRRNNHNKYITSIGLIIQDLIQRQLGIELANIVSVLKSEEDKELVTQEEQNGQDFIIYKDNKPIYYIEVKSKWDENGRFALSKNQTEKCALEHDRYAVISVNVDRYKKKHTIDKDDIPFDDLKEFVKVNDNLSKDFEKLVIENVTKTELNDPKLIEYRGSIPQKLIDNTGKEFEEFIEDLVQKIKVA